MLPFKLQPVFKNYIWGGRRLIDWGKNSVEPLAESWELAAHPDGDNIILDGELKGFKLSEAAKKFPEMISKNYTPEKNFPLMIKLLDAKNYLSIQVHPDEKYANEHENSHGKTELWYILEHEPEAFIYLGFKEQISKDEFKKAILKNTLPDYLNKIYVHKGDTFLIEPGTIHALGAGILLAELQESSNLTYRVFDYGRGRELHIEKALDVTKTFPVNYKSPRHNKNVIVDFEKFWAQVIDEKYFEIKPAEKFYFVLCLEGKYDFECANLKTQLKRGENIFIPANSDTCKISCLTNSGRFLLARA